MAVFALLPNLVQELEILKSSIFEEEAILDFICESGCDSRSIIPSEDEDESIYYLLCFKIPWMAKSVALRGSALFSGG